MAIWMICILKPNSTHLRLMTVFVEYSEKMIFGFDFDQTRKLHV